MYPFNLFSVNSFLHNIKTENLDKLENADK